MYKSLTLHIIGAQKMACEGCQDRIEHALNTIEGVQRARAKASNQRIEVLFDDAQLDPHAVADRVAKMGYETKVVSS